MAAPTREQQYKDKITRIIRHYTFEYGYNVSKVADLAGMSERTLYDRLKHPGKFSLDEINRIARALHIPRADLAAIMAWSGSN